MHSAPTPVSTEKFVDKVAYQHRLFSELSAMFGREVPLYDKSLLVNKICNQAVCDLLKRKHVGFSISEEQLGKTSGERHGAIRIGTPEEYRWVAGFFAAFALEPHNFYDMTSLGAKSQPIIATAFRSVVNPEHRVFCSLLMIDYFAPEIRERVEELLAQRQVFSDRAKQLILKNEDQGGLSDADAEELVQEGISRIFKWTGKARNFHLYNDLCDAGFKIAADIACFESHHLNHLTPNTFCMDLYTSAMRYCMGDIEESQFVDRAKKAFSWLKDRADDDYMKLHFRHLTHEDIASYSPSELSEGDLTELVKQLTSRLRDSDLNFSHLNHSGFKDFTEGPDTDTPVLLRQDSYKALTEPVTFHNPDGSTVDSAHTARFGEIEQRFYATTPAGRELYDRCLAEAEAARQANPALSKQDYSAYLEMYGRAFLPFPKTLPELLEKGLVYARYSATPAGKATAGNIDAASMEVLIDKGFLQYEGLRYEDFLPFSAAGIFASNLGQYGTESSGKEKRTYTSEMLAEIMGRPIVDPNVIYNGMQAESLLEAYSDLGLLDQLQESERTALENARALLSDVF